MSYVILKSGSKQYKVTEGETFTIEKLEGLEVGKDLVLTDVLMAANGDKISVGNPLVKGVSVTLEVIDPLHKAKKVIAYKFRRREGYHRTVGHRQRQTKVKVKSITF
ncbi:MAG: 50S ribosomal protein L21 [Verrucomicrobiota bacterium]|nr:50S ribosomal protein L21 [Verrucomicrobiota bacterium]